MKVLYLTCAVPVPTEQAQKKIDEVVKGGGVYRDARGNTKEYYEDLNVKLPNDFYDNQKQNNLEIDEDGMIELKEDDLDYESLSVSIPLRSYSCHVENSNFGSRVYTKDGLYFEVFS
jgi:hypothetical protein